MQREKKIVAGKLMSVSFYPIQADGKQLPRGPKKKKSTAAQAKYNKQKATQRTIMLINANFDTEDLFITATYPPDKAPATIEDANRDIDNYIRRVKTKRASEIKRLENFVKKYPDNPEYKKQLKILKRPLKVVMRTAQTDYKSGVNAGKSNFHFHICITGGIDRDKMEDMWPYRINCDRFRPDKFGPEAVGKYMSRQESDGEKVKIRHTRNLEQPKLLKYKDGQISRRGVESIARKRTEDKEYWEKRYPGYKFLRCFARYNEYNGHWYVTALMYRYGEKETVPEWTISEWLDE